MILKTNSAKVQAAIVISHVLWASSFPAIKFGLSQFSAGSLSLLRYLVASVIIWIAYMSSSFKKEVSLKDYPSLLGAGLVGVGAYSLCLNYGELTVSPGVASFITAMTPIFIMLLAVFFLKEPFKYSNLCYMLLSLSGLGLVVWAVGAKPDFNVGVGYVLLATLAASCYTIMKKFLLAKYEALQIVAFSMWGGVLPMLYFSFTLWDELFFGKVTWSGIFTAVYLGTFPAALAYTCFAYALKYRSATKLAAYSYGMPILATLIAYAAKQEEFNMYVVLGQVLSLLGAVLIQQNRADTTKKT